MSGSPFGLGRPPLPPAPRRAAALVLPDPIYWPNILLAVSFGVIIVNFDELLGAADSLGGGNALNRSLLFITFLAFAATRRISLWRLAAVGLIVLVTMVSAHFTDFYGFNRERYLRGLFSFLVPLLFLTIEPKPHDRDMTIRMLAYGAIACTGLGILYNAVGIHPLFTTSGPTRLQGTTIPSGLGTYGYLGVVAGVFGAVYINERRYMILTTISTGILLLSAARMPLALAALGAASVYGLRLMRSADRVFNTVFFLVPVVAIFLVAFGAEALSRFSDNSLSGRELIWESLEDVLRHYPVFGIGLGHQIVAIGHEAQTLANTVAAHNEYLRLAVELGYPGVTLVFGLLALMVLGIWASPRVGFDMTYLLTASTFFIFAATDNAISSNTTPMVLLLASFLFPAGARPASARVARRSAPSPLRQLRPFSPAQEASHADR